MRPSFLPRAAAFAALAVLLSCEGNHPLAPESGPAAPHFAGRAAGLPAVVISQVYGGGGNSGSTYKNDFIELHNSSGQAVSLAGWSVQYASATGTTWQTTALSGTIQPGAYYLVKESQGAGGTVDLPTPDANGTIAMSATAGKVWLVASTTALTGACPTGSSIADQVSFGTTASDCGYGRTPAPSNTLAVLLGNGGCAYTNALGTDFATGAPTPRNSASPINACAGTIPVGPLDHVTITGPNNVTVGTTAQFTAIAQDVNNQTVASAQVSWSSSDQASATVDQTGRVTGLAESATPVTITATAVDGAITVSAGVQVTVQNPAIHWIDVSSSSTSFPPGFQTQLFATAREASGGTIIPATFSFVSLDPAIATVATVNNTGIITGVAASATRPRIQITATPVGSGPTYQFTTTSITIEAPNPAPTSIYATNDEFGDPTPASTSNPNDLLIVRPQYTLSYNSSHGTPNWVSYELDSRQMVSGQDRCNCFTADPVLPVASQILTSDYTNGGFDRGHMARSADRTAGNTDNAATFYLTNIVPQMADLNQGVWAQFENALADSARAGRAVYIITGPQYSSSHPLVFLKNEGKVAVPDSTWKVAFIGPIGGGVPFALGDVQSWDALPGTTLMAVMMPNIAGVRNDPWAKYLTTVDHIEAATGYDFLSLLPVAFQTAIEAGDRGPTARFTVSGTLNEGNTLGFDAATSTDPDLGRTDMDRTEALSFSWNFGDGSTATGAAPAKAFGHSGTYTVTLTATDAWGWPSTVTHDVTIANVPPHVAPFAGATILRGETYAAAGSFTDPGTATWTATVNYGDGSGSQPLALSGHDFQLSHPYAAAGTFTVTVNVSDGEAADAASATVRVLTPVEGIATLNQMVAALGGLGNGEKNSLNAKIDNASKQCGRGNGNPCGNMLGAFINEIQAIVSSGRLTSAEAAPLIDYAQRLIVSIGS